MKYAIRYRYPGTTNGQPVGVVYAEQFERISSNIWSYAKEAEQATLFATREAAESERRRHRWPESAVVEVA